MKFNELWSCRDDSRQDYPATGLIRRSRRDRAISMLVTSFAGKLSLRKHAKRSRLPVDIVNLVARIKK